MNTHTSNFLHDSQCFYKLSKKDIAHLESIKELGGEDLQRFIALEIAKSSIYTRKVLAHVIVIGMIVGLPLFLAIFGYILWK